MSPQLGTVHIFTSHFLLATSICLTTEITVLMISVSRLKKPWGQSSEAHHTGLISYDCLYSTSAGP